ncbi:MAG: FHA domain-containing protein [Bradymonadia bacterium]
MSEPLALSWLRPGMHHQWQQQPIEGPLTLGRSAEAPSDAPHLQIDHPSVAPHHATVQAMGERYTIADAGTAQGTWVNGRRVNKRALLWPGDIIMLGECTVRCLSRGEAHVTRPEPPRPFEGWPTWQWTLAISEKGSGEEIMVFRKDELTVGRVWGNDIALSKPNVSKRHFRLVAHEGKAVIVDHKSGCGTYLNGRKISAPTVIKANDRIYVGDFVIRMAAPLMTVEEAITQSAAIEAIADSEELDVP